MTVVLGVVAVSAALPLLVTFVAAFLFVLFQIEVPGVSDAGIDADLSVVECFG